MDITEQKNNYQNLKYFFWEANRAFLEKNYVLLDELSERCLCGALMCELNKQLEKNGCKNYYADIEFNRNKKSIKQLPNDDDFLNNILPDIIVHSRGKEILDNLLVLEMKKSSADHQDKENDRNRLRKMTKQNYNGENVEDKILSYEDITKRR